jgi:hypothetical protein
MAFRGHVAPETDRVEIDDQAVTGATGSAGRRRHPRVPDLQIPMTTMTITATSTPNPMRTWAWPYDGRYPVATNSDPGWSRMDITTIPLIRLAGHD